MVNAVMPSTPMFFRITKLYANIEMHKDISPTNSELPLSRVSLSTSLEKTNLRNLYTSDFLKKKRRINTSVTSAAINEAKATPKTPHPNHLMNR